MIDVKFYMKVHSLKQAILRGELKGADKNRIRERFEEMRSKKPVVYDAETTNACNMKCIMCPRNLMTRPITLMDMELFKKILDQIEPINEDIWNNWVEFVGKEYGIGQDEKSENHFFLYVIPKVLVLHGYGEPFLDKHMPERIKFLSEKNIPSYFSATPANINIDNAEEIFANGLTYIKFCIESIDDDKQKKIRGPAADFTESKKKIFKLLELKKKHNYKTAIIITMTGLDYDWQKEEFEKLKVFFKDEEVYVYFKSQNQKWFQDKDSITKSIHWAEFCQFPWSSMTIKSNGKAVGCIGDYDAELIVGDTKKETLYDIWNGRKYAQLRREQFGTPLDCKCAKRCDMKMAGDLL